MGDQYVVVYDTTLSVCDVQVSVYLLTRGGWLVPDNDVVTVMYSTVCHDIKIFTPQPVCRNMQIGSKTIYSRLLRHKSELTRYMQDDSNVQNIGRKKMIIMFL